MQNVALRSVLKVLSESVVSGAHSLKGVSEGLWQISFWGIWNWIAWRKHHQISPNKSDFSSDSLGCTPAAWQRRIGEAAMLLVEGVSETVGDWLEGQTPGTEMSKLGVLKGLTHNNKNWL